MDVKNRIDPQKWDATVRRVDDSLHAAYAAVSRKQPAKPHLWSHSLGRLKHLPGKTEARQRIQSSRS